MATAASARPPHAAQDLAAIVHLQKISAHQLDSLLPAVALGAWLQDLVGDTIPLQWETNDCGEQTGASGGVGADSPSCVRIQTSESSPIYLSVTVIVGTARQGISGKPEVMEVIVGSHGHHRPLNALSDLLISAWK